MLELHCPQCRNIVGRVVLGRFVLRHAGRVYYVALDGLQECECEDCGRRFPIKGLIAGTEQLPEPCPA